jgi:hypothetical protein
MFNFCLALHSCTEEEKTKLAIAACFHDLGSLVDFIPWTTSHLRCLK